MSYFTKFYTDEKLKGRIIPSGKKYKEQMFFGSEFPDLIFFVDSNLSYDEAVLATKRSANLKDEPVTRLIEEINFTEDITNYKRMISIYTQRDTFLTILPFDENTPLLGSIKNYKINAKSLLYLSKEIMGFTKCDSKQIRFALGNNNEENLRNILNEINLMKPISVNCQIDYLRALGYSDLKVWEAASADHIYIGRRPPVFVNNVRVSIKKSELAAPKELLASHITDDVFAVEYEKELKKSIDSKAIDIGSYSKKYLGCWCNTNKCSCKIIIQLFLEYNYKRIFHL